MITKKENMMRVMRGQKPDWTPIVALVDNFHFIHPLTNDIIKSNDYIAMQRHFGGDVLERSWNTAPPIARTNSNCERTTSENNGIITDRIITNLGELTQTREVSANKDSFFTREHFVRTDQDYRIYIHLLETDAYHSDLAANCITAAGMANVGDDGISYVVAPCSPIMTIVREVTGIERYLYDYFDYPETMTTLMEIIHQRNIEQYEIIAKHTNADIIVCWDDAETAQMSPKMFSLHVVPTIREYARICHKYGKLLAFHNCGAISNILGLFPEMEIDAVDWVQHKSIGDVTFDKVEQAWGGRIAILGSISPDVFKTSSEIAVEHAIEEIAKEVTPLSRFMFMMPPPQGTPEELMEFAMKTARKILPQ